MIYDVIVIGMGPAGAMAAFESASCGLSVLALDKSFFPRYKACGGGITTKINPIFDIENHSCIENTISSLRLSFCSEKKHFQFDQPVAYMVMREKFDHILVKRAIKAGVDFKSGQKVLNIIEQKENVEIYTNHNVFKGKLVVGADGGLGITTRWLNPKLRIRNAPGIEGEFKKDMSSLDSSTIEIEVNCVKSGYGWIFPKQETLSIGVATFFGNQKIKKAYLNYVASSLEPSNGSAVPIKETGHPLPIYDNPRLKLCSKRLILAGDAGHLIDPFFGEGIYFAMRSGQLAGKAAKNFIDHGTPLVAYQKAIQKEFYPEFRGAKRLAYVVYRFPKLWFDLTARHPGAIQLYAEVLSGKRSYRNYLTTILKTAFKSTFMH